MAKQDGGIIVLDDDDDEDDELKVGSWIARPWKLPSSLNVETRTLSSSLKAQPLSPPSTSGVDCQKLKVVSQTPPSTSKAPPRTPSPSTSNTRPQTPPSTSKSRPRTHNSNSTNLPASQSSGSDTTPLLYKEAVQSSLKATNENLFKEFMDFCGKETSEHPEVMSFLESRYHKASPAFLCSTEFRNVIGRCLTRVQNKKSKVYVYINELCTVLKSNSEKKKVALSSVPASKSQVSRQLRIDPPADNPAEEPADEPGEEDENQEAGEDAEDEAQEERRPSKRQIRYLENLLSVYTAEIRRLQEKDLDLTQLDNEDSIYIQENRLKRKMIRIFQKLCELKRCCDRTGRVIEQRIPYRGTRYPEVNRRIQKFINKPDNFPDYGDILKVIEKACIRHNLELSKRQMQSMAADAFRDVGNRLQERRHLDMVYNFGSHLTDKYKAGTDPALMDPVLSRRLRENRTVALSHLDEVVKKYAVLQDDGEEELDRKKRRGGSTHHLRRGVKGSAALIDQESDEDDDDEDESSDTDIEEELEKCEDMSEPEDEAQVEEESVPDITESDQRMDNRSEPSQFSSAGEEVEDDDDEDDEEDEEDEEDDDGSVQNGEDPKEPGDDSGAVTQSGSPEGSVTDEHSEVMERKSESTECKSESKKRRKGNTRRSHATENSEEPMVLGDDTIQTPEPDTPGTSVIENIENEDSMDYECNLDAIKNSLSEPSKSSEGSIQEEIAVLPSETHSPRRTSMETSDPKLVPIKTQVKSKSSKTCAAPTALDRFQSSFEMFCSSSLGPADSQPDPEMVSQESGDSPLSPPAHSALPGSFLSSSGTGSSQAHTPSPISAGSDMEHAPTKTSCEPLPVSFPVPSASRRSSVSLAISKNPSRRSSRLQDLLPTSGPSASSPSHSDSSRASESQVASPRPSESQVASPALPQLETTSSNHSGSPGTSPRPSALSSSSLGLAESPFSTASRSGTPSPRPPVCLTPPLMPSGSPNASQRPPDSTTIYPKLPASSSASSLATSPRPTSFQTTSPRPADLQTASPRPTSSQTKSPRPSGSQTVSPRPTGSQTPSPKPTSSQTPSPRLTGSQPTSPRLTGSQNASPKCTSFRTASPRPTASTSPRPFSPKLAGASPRFPVCRASSPVSSRSSLSPPGSLAASPGGSGSTAGSPDHSNSLSSGASRFQSNSSGTGESELFSRTNSVAPFDSSVVGSKASAFLDSDSSYGVGVTAKESRLCGDAPRSSLACKDLSAGRQSSLKVSKDCLLIEQTVTPKAEPLLMKDFETPPWLPHASLTTCGTRMNFKSETPVIMSVRRKRTLSGTVRTLQSKREAALQENGRNSTIPSVNGSPRSAFFQSNHQSKRVKREERHQNSSTVEVHSIDSDDDKANLSLDMHVTCVSPDSPVPLADSTQDSPFHSLVSSSRQQHKCIKINAATQCDPEEVIVLSDSD